MATSSAYLAAEMGLLSERTRDYIFSLFLDWVQVPEARAIWTDVFRVQAATFPAGFVDFLDTRLAASAPRPPPRPDAGEDRTSDERHGGADGDGVASESRPVETS